MKKSYIQKGAIVIVVLLLFIGFIQYRDYENTHFKVDRKTFHVKNSEDQIMNEVYNKYPDLKNMFKYGIGMDVNKEVPVLSERRDLKLEKAFIAPGMIYISYSMTLLKEDKSLKNIPSLEIGKITFHRDNGPDFSADVANQEDFAPPSISQSKDLKETFNHRVYQSLYKPFNFNNINFKSMTEAQNFQKEYIDHVTGITLGKVKLVLGKKKTSIDSIKLPLKFNLDKYLIKTIPINKDIQLGDMRVKVKDYKQFINRGELNYQADNGSINNILNIVADVHVTGGSKIVGWDTNKGVPKTLFLSDGITYFPYIDAKSITITPKEYGYLDPASIKIHLDKAKIKELQADSNLEIKIADIKNGSVFFSINHTEDWQGFNIIFKYDKTKYPHVGEMNWVIASQIQGQTEEEQRLMSHSNPVIDIKDDEGHSLSTFDSNGIVNENGRDIYQFSGGMIDWLNFSGLDITLKSLTYVNKITTEPITIPLKK